MLSCRKDNPEFAEKLKAVCTEGEWENYREKC